MNTNNITAVRIKNAMSIGGLSDAEDGRNDFIISMDIVFDSCVWPVVSTVHISDNFNSSEAVTVDRPCHIVKGEFGDHIPDDVFDVVDEIIEDIDEDQIWEVAKTGSKMIVFNR
jgi:hypothetical protein